MMVATNHATPPGRPRFTVHPIQGSCFGTQMRESRLLKYTDSHAGPDQLSGFSHSA